MILSKILRYLHLTRSSKLFKKFHEYAQNVYWLVCLEVEQYIEAERNALMKALGLKGIETRPYFYPVSDMPIYQQNPVETPIAHKVYQRGINLPSYFGLTPEEIEYVCDCLRSHLELEVLI